jgi:hypothetical protein
VEHLRVDIDSAPVHHAGDQISVGVVGVGPAVPGRSSVRVAGIAVAERLPTLAAQVAGGVFGVIFMSIYGFNRTSI